MYVPRSFKKSLPFGRFACTITICNEDGFSLNGDRGAGIIADLVFHRPRGQAVEYIYAFTIRSRAWTSNMLDKV